MDRLDYPNFKEHLMPQSFALHILQLSYMLLPFPVDPDWRLIDHPYGINATINVEARICDHNKSLAS